MATKIPGGLVVESALGNKVGGFKYSIFYFHPDEPNLTSIFFKWVEKNHQLGNHFP